MTKIKYDINLMKFISLFESISRAKVKDCFEEGEKLVFVVYQNEIAKAIGKNGANVKKISALLKKPLKIVEFNDDVLGFVKNYILPLTGEVSKDGENVVIKAPNAKTKGQLFGRERSNLACLKEATKRYFVDIDIKIE
jgi:transcription termination/antitermination protein NusA